MHPDDFPGVDPGRDTSFHEVQTERRVVAFIAPKDSASGLDSAPGVVFGAPDERREVQVAERGWYRVGTDMIDAKEGNRVRSFSYDDHGAWTNCPIARVVHQQPAREGP
jgi:hypothetical protein